jgi:phosphoserine phosphatase
MSDLYVISAVGKDQPGLVHRVAQVLSDLNVNIVDIEARSVRGHFMMFLVVDMSTSPHDFDTMIKALEPAEAYFDLGLKVKVYDAGRRKADKRLMALTIMGIDRPGIVASLTKVIARNGVNIEKIKMIARGEYIAIELSVDVSELASMEDFRQKMYDYSADTGLDVSLRDDNLFKKTNRVVVFDCDSTIIREEVIDEMAKVAGVGRRVKALTDQAMNGELDYNQAIRERVKLLKGLSVKQLEKLSSTIHLTPGAEELISALHLMGHKVAVISGGFSFFTNYLKERLNLDYVFANELEIEDGVTTGCIKGDIVGPETKAEIINEIAREENISVDQIVAVGDGANDRFMLEKAGLAIGFNPKKILKEYSDGIITSDNIFGLLYFLGAPDSVLDNIEDGNGHTNGGG